MKLLVTFATFLSTVLALNAVKPTGPPVNTCLRTVAYWGQNSAGLQLPKAQWEKPLDQYCKDTTFDVIILSFLHIFYNGNPALPGVNFANHCETAPFPGYPYLLSCPDIQAGIKTCQAAGKIILLSLGGATGNALFSSEQAATDYADLLWKMFFLGSDTAVPRPFGDANIDGIDLDIEAGSPVGLAALINRLRFHYDQDPAKTYYISGAPQCPFPDFYLGPTGTMVSNYALSAAYFDFVFVQFYNNFCGIQNYGTTFFNFADWNKWALDSKTLVFLGVPAASYSGSGYQPASGIKTIAQSLIDTYSPAKGGMFGGVMMWDAGSGDQNIANGVSFAQDVSTFLKSKSPANACSAFTAPPPSSPPPPSGSSSVPVVVPSSSSMAVPSSSPVVSATTTSSDTMTSSAVASSSNMAASSSVSVITTTVWSCPTSSSSSDAPVASSSVDIVISSTDAVTATSTDFSLPVEASSSGDALPTMSTWSTSETSLVGQPTTSPDVSMPSSSVSSDPSPAPEPPAPQPPIVAPPLPSPVPNPSQPCVCPATDGFEATRAPGFAIKRCSPGFGVILNACSCHTGGACSWGQPKSFCVGK